MRKKTATIALTACLLAHTGLVMGAVTEEIFLHVNQSADDYWHIAPANPVVLQCQKPSGAFTADFYAYHSGASVIHESVEADSVSFGTGRAVESSADERVFDLTLAFDDPVETVRKSSIAFLADVSEVRNPDGHYWNQVKGAALLPVPAAASSLTVGGVDIPIGMFSGTDCWRFFRANVYDAPVEMELSSGGVQYSASVRCRISGMWLMIR